MTTRIQPDSGTGFDVNFPTLQTIATQNGTLTALQLLGGPIEHTVITGAGTDTTDTGTLIDAAMPGVQNGDTFTAYLINTAGSALAISIAAGAGVTIKGSTATVPQNKMATLLFRRVAAATWTCYVSISA